MTNWFTVFRYELRQQVRRKAYLFMTFGVPLLIVAGVFGYQAFQDMNEDEADEAASPISEANEESKIIGLVDETPEGLFPGPLDYEPVDCALSEQDYSVLNITDRYNTTLAALIQRISSPYCLRDNIVPFATQNGGKQALEDGDIDVLYVIEPDYVETGQASLYFRGFSFDLTNSEQVAEDFVLRSLLNDLPSLSYVQLYLRLRDPAIVTQHKLTAVGIAEEDSSDSDFIMVYAFGLALMLSTFWSGGYLMQSVVAEKESRIIEIVLSSVRPVWLLLGKILAMGALALLQIGMLIGAFVIVAGQLGDISAALQNVEIEPATVILVLLYFLLGYLFSGSLMAAIGALSTSMREAQNFVVVVTLPSVIPFFFLTLFAENPDGTLPVILSMIPITSPLSMVMRASVSDVPLGEVGLSVALLMLGVVFAVWFSGRLFRVNTLLMGNMPRLRDIPHLLRKA